MKKIDVTKLRKKSVRNIGLGIGLVGVAVVLVGGSYDSYSVIGIGFVISLAGFALAGLATRCPSCGAFLGRSPGRYCPGCGKSLDLWRCK